MAKYMKVAVIVTANNTEQYIRKCLDSLVNQTLKDLSITIVDDASTDGTPDIINEYVNAYSNLSAIVLKKNAGPGGARNAALKHVGSEYVSFIDSDDWVDLNFYQKLYDAAQQYEADIVSCGLIRKYDTPTTIPVYKCKYDRDYILTGETAFRIMTNEYDMGIKFLPSALNKLYRTSFLNDNSLCFLENVFFEDQPFSYQSTLAAKKIVCVSDVLYYHFRRKNSIVQSFHKKNIDDMLLAYSTIKKYLEQNLIYEKYKWNYYSSIEHFYNLIIRQIYEFVFDDESKKQYIKYSFAKLKAVIDIDEYINYCSVEKLRKHIQPFIDDTTIY